MKKKHSDNVIPVTEQAAEWFVELSEPPLSEATRRDFFAWLKRSPQNIEEFLAIAALNQEVSRYPSVLAEVIDDLEAAQTAPPGTVALFTDVPSERGRPMKPAASRGLRAVAWAAAAGMAAMAALYLANLPAPEMAVVSHRTEMGEQRSIALADGSIVTLNTLSEATVRFEDKTRRVTLVSGEAMFDVARDQGRPFVVDVGSMSLNVVGTKFSVYRQGDATRVAVVEGVVSAISRLDPNEATLLRGGEGAVFTNDGGMRRDEAFDVEKAVAWIERRLVFDNARLADVVREFNRYNRLQLTVEDEALANRQITTVVNAHDVSALIGFLQLQPDVEIDYGPDAIRIKTEME